MIKSILSCVAALSLATAPALALPGQAPLGTESPVTQVQAKQDAAKDGAKAAAPAGTTAAPAAGAPKDAAKTAPAAAAPKNADY